MAIGAALLVCFLSLFSFLSLASCRSLAFLSCAFSAGYLASSLKRFLADMSGEYPGSRRQSW